MNDIGEMLTKATEGVARQFNAQVEASIAMLVNLGIPLERIELINRTAEDLSVVTEIRSRTSDEAQAVATEREAILALINARYYEVWEQMADAITERGRHTVRDSRAFGRVDELARLMDAIRSGEHNRSKP